MKRKRILTIFELEKYNIEMENNERNGWNIQKSNIVLCYD